MKRLLPVIIFVFGIFFLLAPNSHVFAQPAPTPDPGRWIADAEVTFVGKTGSRSDAFLSWTLQNYKWLTPVNGNNPLVDFWKVVRNIVYALVALFILGTAFVLVITRGQNITVMKFLPRFILIIVLITFSFSLIQLVYQAADVIQEFFLKPSGPNGPLITTQDLLYIGFPYKGFEGYRLVGSQNDESAFMSLLLVRLTAITYYVMTGVLLIRKIILWFFIILSPVFPLLLFYSPIRNTGKVWIGEFFRWLFYAPLFAIFLNGVVQLWRTGIPLPFPQIAAGDPGKIGSVVYPTAINILLGGPGQQLGLYNSVNLRDTFALYVVALLMLWVVILLPFLLLKIFLDYLNTLSFGNSLLLKQVMSKNFGFLNPKTPPPPSTPPPGFTQPAGMARTLPFFAAKQPATVLQSTQVNTNTMVRESTEVLRLANLSIPKMRDIARYESSMLSSDVTKRQEVANLRHNLSRIGNPSVVAVPGERNKFSTVREKLVEQKQKGNPVAASVLSASKILTQTTTKESQQEKVGKFSEVLHSIANPESVVNPVDRERFTKLRDKLKVQKEQGDKMAESVLSASEQVTKSDSPKEEKDKVAATLMDQLLMEEEKGNVLADSILPAGILQKEQKAVLASTTLPNVNRVQQVSLDDYEEVRKMWVENYQSIEPPKNVSGQPVDRAEWIKNDIEQINQAITLLTSSEPAKVNEGMEMVANILPFLLIGGFSKTEVVAYLKAKLSAAKSSISDINKKEEEEDTMISSRTQKEEKPKEMSESASVPGESAKEPEKEDKSQAVTSENIVPELQEKKENNVGNNE